MYSPKTERLLLLANHRLVSPAGTSKRLYGLTGVFLLNGETITSLLFLVDTRPEGSGRLGSGRMRNVSLQAFPGLSRCITAASLSGRIHALSKSITEKNV